MPEQPTTATDRALTPLLSLITTEALERDYQYAASRRSGEGAPREKRSRTAAVAVVVLCGLLAAMAAAQTTRNADVRDASRAQVINRIEINRDAQARAEGRIDRLRASNASTEEDLSSLGLTLSAEQARVTSLRSTTGFGSVSGEGIQITFDNRADADPMSEWVRDADVAGLVNGLWLSGAEAIAINGQRITGSGGIRNVGVVVEINSRAIAPPYNVSAIGNSKTLSAELLETSSGAEFFDLALQYGWGARTKAAADLRIPAAPEEFSQIASARPLDIGKTGGSTR